jgi:LmbE family N-acetylglucosaminyl deacetylase
VKYKFSIIASHPYDEFIGCNKLIKTYPNNIDNIIFLTNGERDVICLQDTLRHIKRRRTESYRWINTVCNNCDIHYLNFPDTIDIMKDHIYGDKIFEQMNGQTIFSYLREKIWKIAGDNIIVCPSPDSHPSRHTAFVLCEMLSNKRIYYSVWDLITKTSDKAPGIHYTKTKMFNEKYFSYIVVLSEKEDQKKRKDFELFYSSQNEFFNKVDIKIRNWEQYISEVPLMLGKEDETYKMESK